MAATYRWNELTTAQREFLVRSYVQMGLNPRVVQNSQVFNELPVDMRQNLFSTLRRPNIAAEVERIGTAVAQNPKLAIAVNEEVIVALNGNSEDNSTPVVPGNNNPIVRTQSASAKVVQKAQQQSSAVETTTTQTFQSEATGSGNSEKAAIERATLTARNEIMRTAYEEPNAYTSKGEFTVLKTEVTRDADGIYVARVSITAKNLPIDPQVIRAPSTVTIGDTTGVDLSALAAERRRTNHEADLLVVNTADLAAADAVLARKQERAGQIVGLNPDPVAKAIKVETINGVVVITDANNVVTRVVSAQDEIIFNQTQNKVQLQLNEDNNQLRAYQAWAVTNNILPIQEAVTVDRIEMLGNSKLKFADFEEFVNQQQALGLEVYDRPFTALETNTNLSARSKVLLAKGTDTAGNRILDATAGGAVNTGGTLTDEQRAAIANNGADQVVDLENAGSGTPTSKPRVDTNGLPVAGRDDSQPLSGNLIAQSVLDAQASSVSSINTNTGALGNIDAPRPILPNPLLDYQYTYGISLHILDKKEYNLMIQNKQGWKPSNTIVASAGRNIPNTTTSGSSGMSRAAEWEDNFFFDGLKLTGIMGLNAMSRGTNVFDIKFTILEPHGLSFVDRLIKTSARLQEKNYSACCYLLQIDFFDVRYGKIPHHTKMIPMRITDLKVKVTSKGSEYHVAGIPFNHQAMLQTVATSPATFEVNAGTLREYFRANNGADRAIADAAVREIESTNKGVGGAGTRTNNSSATNTDVKTYKINSYVSAYNGWHDTLKKLKIVQHVTSIQVKFHDEFLTKERIIRTNDTTVGVNAMANNDRKGPGDSVREDTQSNKFVVPAGMPINEVINNVMLNSEYIREQVLVAEKGNNTAAGKQNIGATRWWKIMPQVELGEYDTNDNKWAFNIIYFVMPYITYNTTHPNLPKARPDKNICNKVYYYLYTGKNTEVIDFNMEFNFLYFTKVIGLRDKNIDAEIEYEQGTEEPNNKNNNTSYQNAVNPAQKHRVTDEVKRLGKNATNDTVGMAAVNASESLYSTARGEMLNAKLRIIGDPQLIKQDDVYFDAGRYYKPSDENQNSDGVRYREIVGPGSDILTYNNNSLLMDWGDLNCWIEVKLPVDYNEATGAMRTGKSYDTASFMGVYRIIEIESEFKNGSFTQSMELIRYSEQPYDQQYLQKITEKNAQRNSALTPGDGRQSGGADSNSTENSVPQGDAKSSAVITSASTAGDEETQLPQAIKIGPPVVIEDDRAGPANNITIT